jgi:hypothetical protein
LALCVVLAAGSVRLAAADEAGKPESTPVQASDQCPSAEAVWAALQPVVSPGGAPTATAPPTPIAVEDFGDGFQVTVNGRQREYADDARDCARRARMAAVFAALALGVSLPEQPPPREPAVRVSAAEPRPVRTRATTEIELGPAFESSVGSSDGVALIGASARVAVGGSRVKAVGGVAVLAPGDATVGAVTISHTHVPLDLGVRVVTLATRWELSVDVGVAAGWLRLRPTGVEAAETATVLEWGARAGVVLRYRAWAHLAPFIGGAAQWVASPADLFVLPRGVVGQAPRVWLSASAGANVGF